MINSTTLLAGNIKALFDTWILGDSFLKDLSFTYESIKQQAEKNKSKEDKPYLLQYYNVKLLYKQLSQGVHRTVATILNTLIEQFNNIHILPRFLVVIIDKDILTDIDVFDSHAISMLTDDIQWLVGQINAAVTRKKSEIIERRPGAIFTGDPKIIFVRMLRRFEKYTSGSKLDILYGMRSKFNDCLNAAVAEIDQRMLTITSCNTRDHFDFYGNLSVKGKFEFWREMDELLDRFDRREIKLLPAPQQPNQKKREDNSDDRLQVEVGPSSSQYKFDGNR